MADHDHEGTLHTDDADAPDPQHHETEVADRGVGHELLDVGLHHRNQSAVDDSDYGEQHHQASDPGREGYLGKERHRKSEEPIGSDFEHDGGQQDAAGRGCLDVCIGKPGVKREHRDLDRECQSEGAAEPRVPALASRCS